MLSVADRLIEVRRDRRAGWASDDEHEHRTVTLSVRSKSCGCDDRGDAPDDVTTSDCACESVRPIGTVGQLREFLSSARRSNVDVSSTARRGFDRATGTRSASDGEVVQLVELAAMYHSVDALTAQLRTQQKLGVGIVDTTPTVDRAGLLRCWSSGTTRPELIRHGRVTIGVAAESIDIVFGDARPTIRDVRSFHLSVDGAIVTDADDLEHVLDDDATAALCRLAPEATGFRVRRVPEVLAWAGLRATLESTLEDALNAGRGARVGLRSPEHARQLSDR